MKLAFPFKSKTFSILRNNDFRLAEIYAAFP